MKMRYLRSFASVLCIGVATFAALGASDARADAPTPEALTRAREEFRRGLALESAGDYEGALVAFKGVAGVKSTPQVRFHIAVCEEKVGDWVGSLGSYRMAQFEAQDGKVKDVESESQTAIARLEKDIPMITLHRGAGAAVAKVILDGRELGNATIGAPIRVNPGTHRISASAPGHETWTKDVVLAAGKSEEVGITLKALPEPPLAGKPGATGPGGAVEDAGPSALLPVAITTLVLGGAGLAVSGVFFGLRQSAIDELDTVCGPDGQSCPASAAQTQKDGQLYDVVTTASFFAGLGVTVLGGTLLIVELSTGSSEPEGAAPQVGDDAPAAPETSLTVRFSPSGLSLAGTF